jgi:hypothetical protein
MRILICTLLLIPIQLLSQLDSSYRDIWQTRIQAGINIPITSLPSSDPSTSLIEYSNHSQFLQLLSATYFFNRKWGIEFNYQGISSPSLRNRQENFSNKITPEFSEEYFVDVSSGAQYDKFNFFSRNFERGLLGIVYRIEKNKFFIQPKLALGVTSFYTDWGNVDLKQRNSNRRAEVQYTPTKSVQDPFTIAPSVIVGYTLTRRLYLHTEIMLSHFQTSFSYIKTTEDFLTEEINSETINYHKNILTLSIGTGLIYVIK